MTTRYRVSAYQFEVLEAETVQQTQCTSSSLAIIDDLSYTEALRMAKRERLPDAVLDYFRKQGSVGGKKRAQQMSPEQRSEQARKAVNSRWAKQRNSKKISEKKSK